MPIDTVTGQWTDDYRSAKQRANDKGQKPIKTFGNTGVIDNSTDKKQETNGYIGKPPLATMYEGDNTDNLQLEGLKKERYKLSNGEIKMIKENGGQIHTDLKTGKTTIVGQEGVTTTENKSKDVTIKTTKKDQPTTVPELTQKEEQKTQETKKLNLDDVNVSDKVKEYISRGVEKGYTQEETKEKLKTELSKLGYDVSSFENDYGSLFNNYNEYNRTKEDFVNGLISGQTYDKWYEKNSTDFQEAKKVYEKIKGLDLSDEGIKSAITSGTLDNETISYLSNNEQYKKAIQEGIKIKNEKIFNEATTSDVAKMNSDELLKFTQNLLNKMGVTEKYETIYDEDESLNGYKTEIETATIELTSLYSEMENIRATVEANNPGASPRMIDMLVARERANIDVKIGEAKNKVNSYNNLYKIREGEISRTIGFKQNRATQIKSEFDKIYNQNLSIEFADISARKQWTLETEKKIEKMNSDEGTWQNTKDGLYFVKNNGEYIKAVGGVINEQYEENGYEISRYKQEDGSYITTKKNLSTGNIKTTHSSPIGQEILGSGNGTGEVFSGNGGTIDIDENMIRKYPGQAWAKNNNVAGLTFSKSALKRFKDAGIDVYGGTDRPAKEGGKYLSFGTLRDGFKAYEMLWKQPWYQNKTVRGGLEQWGTLCPKQNIIGGKCIINGKIVGKSIKLEGIDDLLNKKVSNLTDVEKTRLYYAQLSKESPGLIKELEKKGMINKPKKVSYFHTKGFRSIGIKDVYKLEGPFISFPKISEKSKSIAQKYNINNEDEVLDYYNIVSQQLPTKDRDSDADKARLKKMSISYIKRGYDYPTAVLKVLGIPLPKKQEDLNLLIDYQNTLNGLLGENYSSKVLKSMSTHINNGEYSKAKAILNSNIDPRLKKDSDLYTDANTLAIQKNYTDKIVKLATKVGENNIGILDTPISNIKQRLGMGEDEYTQFRTTFEQYLAGFRKSIAGTAVTDEELKQIKNFADANSTYSLKYVINRINQMFENNLGASNSVRKLNGIPTISKEELGGENNYKTTVHSLYNK